MSGESTELFSGFHKLSREERLQRLRAHADLSAMEVRALSGEETLTPEVAEHLIENVIGTFTLPMGVATYFKIDGRDIAIPMAVEETSIIAAASATAKWVRSAGEITTRMEGDLIIGQIQIPRAQNVEKAKTEIATHREMLIGLANACVPGLVSRGGGVRDIIVRELPRADGTGTMLVLHVLCDPCDAMGANLINQVCEALKPRVELISGEKVGLCILSNLTDGKLAVAEIVLRDVDPVVGHGIAEAAQFAKTDPYRAATHNKGVMNGVDPILIATGNDWRAVEAGVHAYAARTGRYQPITDWWMDGKNLHGRFCAPLTVGTVGGVTKLHPTAKAALRLLGVQHAEELSRIAAAVGLVQNLGALKALATVGIVKGHMQLHAANLAIAAGAEIHEVGAVRDRLSEILKVEKGINVTRAREVLAQLRSEERDAHRL
jgi:hydroxymethylglutaryl-CoA reductase